MTVAQRIAVIGAMVPGARIHQRVAAMRRAGHDVHVIDTAPPGRRYEDTPSLMRRLRHRLRRPADETGANAQLVAAAAHTDIAWLENATVIRAASLQHFHAESPDGRIVWYAEDDMMSPRHGSVWIDRALPLFDLWVTTKSFNAAPAEMPSRGVRRAMFVNNSFDPELHRPVAVTDADRARLGAPVSFVGTYEQERAGSLLHLAEAGIGVRVWGNGWGSMAGRHPNLTVEGRAIYDEDYVRIICASDINLCFLRKANRDLQTTRSVEIPACGGFMLHERNAEIAALFGEDREAGYFGSDDELIAACRRWLSDGDARAAVARAGHDRARKVGLSHDDMIAAVLDAARTEASRAA
jgi:spore maturation protein CgeB